MTDASPHPLTQPTGAPGEALEELATRHGVLADVLAIAAGAALGLLAVLFCGIRWLAWPALPAWYYVLGVVGMTAAIYAQLMQRRERPDR